MAKLVRKGGKGSGNWGHAGRPGKVGGSAKVGNRDTLFPRNDYIGQYTGDVKRMKTLESAGFSDEVLQGLLLNKDIPADVLVKMHNIGDGDYYSSFSPSYYTATEYASFYQAHKNDEAFQLFLDSGMDIEGMDRLLEIFDVDKLDRDLFMSIKDVADTLEIPMKQAVEFSDFIPEDYGYSGGGLLVDDLWTGDIDQIKEYVDIGITNPEVADRLAYEVGDAQTIKRRIDRYGADPNDIDELLTDYRLGEAEETIGMYARLKYDAEIYAMEMDDPVLDETGEVASVDAQRKHVVVSALADDTGESYDAANRFIGQWASSSNKGADSMFVQSAIAKVFSDKGVHLSEWQKSFYGVDDAGAGLEKTATEQRVFESSPPEAIASAEKMIREVYQDTQYSLSTASVYVHRGMTIPRSELKGATVGDLISLDQNAAESWSANINTAANFTGDLIYEGKGKTNKDDLVSVIVSASIPSEYVLSTPFTGIGCLSESEFVVLGGSPIKAEITSLGKDGGTIRDDSFDEFSDMAVAANLDF